MKKIFLGGTCGKTDWRSNLINRLPNNNFFNPVVKDWTKECIEIENQQKKICSIHFYLINSEMQGVYSIAEVIDSVHTKDKLTILHVQPDGFNKAQLKSLKAVIELVNNKGGIAYFSDFVTKSAGILRMITETYSTFNEDL